ncbi:zinc-dependent peptidase [Marinobacter sp.]|uniref:M90 family metallopeptidase n=1 Tax=Marinobacter sp. TaxID=50741 RepID=UPI00384F2D3E
MTGYGLALVAIVLGAFYGLFIHPRLRRKRIRAREFPAVWRQQLSRDMALYRRLPPDVRRRLHQNTLLILDEVNFYGCADLEVTEARKVLIAAHAGLLVTGLSVDYYRRLQAILVYPGAYRSAVEWQDGSIAGVSREDRLGESWDTGRVILGWDQLAREAADPETTSNVLLHEFAHQLDQLDGDADGAPPLGSGAVAAHWEEVFSDAWERLQAEGHNGRGRHEQGVIDRYGATSPAEFFAVVTEAFFLTPVRLRDAEPALYECLERFYGLSPAGWPEARQT